MRELGPQENYPSLKEEVEARSRLSRLLIKVQRHTAHLEKVYGISWDSQWLGGRGYLMLAFFIQKDLALRFLQNPGLDFLPPKLDPHIVEFPSLEGEIQQTMSERYERLQSLNKDFQTLDSEEKEEETRLLSSLSTTLIDEYLLNPPRETEQARSLPEEARMFATEYLNFVNRNLLEEEDPEKIEEKRKEKQPRRGVLPKGMRRHPGRMFGALALMALVGGLIYEGKDKIGHSLNIPAINRTNEDIILPLPVKLEGPIDVLAIKARDETIVPFRPQILIDQKHTQSITIIAMAEDLKPHIYSAIKKDDFFDRIFLLDLFKKPLTLRVASGKSLKLYHLPDINHGTPVGKEYNSEQVVGNTLGYTVNIGAEKDQIWAYLGNGLWAPLEIEGMGMATLETQEKTVLEPTRAIDSHLRKLALDRLSQAKGF